jgi:hypothetical protein
MSQHVVRSQQEVSTLGARASSVGVNRAMARLAAVMLACVAALCPTSTALAQPTPRGYVPPPPVTSEEWESWYAGLLELRLAAAPRARANTFYFSQAGNDATGDGSIERPWKTLAKAQLVLDSFGAGGGNVALLFRRGDVWREQRGIDTSTSHVTIADYGIGPKPLFTPFVPVDPQIWEKETRFANVWSFPEQGDITWVKQDDNFDRPMARVSSILGVQNTQGSWFRDGLTRRLYVHPHPVRVLEPAPGPDGLWISGPDALVPPQYLNIEIVRPTDAGVIVRGHGSRIENIRAVGWGMQLTTPSQQHGIEARVVGNAEAVIIRCDSHYGSSHTMTHLAAGDGGGIVTFFECTSGLTMPNNSGETIFNTFSFTGGQEVIFHRCIATHGTMPADSWQANPANGSKRGKGFYAHTGGPQFGLVKLFITYECSVRGDPIGFESPSHAEDLPQVSSLAQVHGFFIRDNYTGGVGGGVNFPIAPKGSVRYGGRYEINPPRSPAMASWEQDGWVVNTTFVMDLRRQNGWYALYNALPGRVNRVRIYNSAFIMQTNPQTLFWVDFDQPNQSPGTTLVNSIISNSGPGVARIGLDASALSHNAYFGVVASEYAADTGAVVLSEPVEPDAVPGCQSLLACAAGPLPEGLSLYADRLQVTRTRDTIGPIEAATCADFNDDGKPDFFDYLDFVHAFAIESIRADINRDGIVDFFDYLDFVGIYSGGC